MSTLLGKTLFLSCHKREFFGQTQPLIKPSFESGTSVYIVIKQYHTNYSWVSKVVLCLIYTGKRRTFKKSKYPVMTI